MVHGSSPPDARASGSARASALLFVAFALAIAAGFAVAGELPELASRHGASIDAVIRYLLVTTGALFLLGHGVLAFFVLRYAGGGARGRPRASARTEWRWALGPVLVMCVLAEGGVLIVGMPAFAQLYGDAPEDAVTVEVVGKQFEWLVRYPGPDGVFGKVDASLVSDARNPVGLDKSDPASRDDVVKRGVLHLPAGRTAVLRLRALDVIHSFTVPQFRVKQDLVPGFLGRTQLVPTRVGRYELACAELCGLGHYRMRGFVEVQTEADFAAWMREEEPWF